MRDENAITTSRQANERSIENASTQHQRQDHHLIQLIIILLSLYYIQRVYYR